MLTIDAQLSRNFLQCPQTGNPLKWSADRVSLQTADGGSTYLLTNGIPLLLRSQQEATEHLQGSAMSDEYERLRQPRSTPSIPKRLIKRIRNWLSRDDRNPKSSDLFRILDAAKEEDLCLSIGGGPLRVHSKLVNLNLAPFVNVDIVADAHHLPYSDGCVSVIFIEAVLEHLTEPHQAIAEMFRVLRSGGQIISITPFLQAYHGYPHHYQNLTLTGHQHWYRRAGFEVVESGSCVGGGYALRSFAGECMRFWLGERLRLLQLLIEIGLATILKPLDRIFNSKRESSHMIASTTFVLARKPFALIP